MQIIHSHPKAMTEESRTDNLLQLHRQCMMQLHREFPPEQPHNPAAAAPHSKRRT